MAAKVVKIVIVFVLTGLVIMRMAGLRVTLVTGDSMLPTLANPQLTIAREVKPDGLDEGDIGVYLAEDSDLVSHRVIYKTGSGYVFKGDNNVYYDEFVTKDRVKYKIICY